MAATQSADASPCVEVDGTTPSDTSNDEGKRVTLEWESRELGDFIEVAYEDGVYARSTQARDEVLRRLPVVSGILDKRTPGWRKQFEHHSSDEFGHIRDAAIAAHTVIGRQEELELHLGPKAPTLSAAAFHPWVWDPARSLWRDGHYSAALHAAAIGLNTQLQDHGNRDDVSAVDLVNQLFTPHPPKPGKPRLRVGDQGNEETTRSVQEGLHSLGKACFQLVRNPAGHILEDLSEDEALEKLAVLSLFARMTQACQVETGAPAD